MIRTEAEARRCFWESRNWNGYVRGRRQNDYPADIRQDWCDMVDAWNRNGSMSDALAQRVTL